MYVSTVYASCENPFVFGGHFCDLGGLSHGKLTREEVRLCLCEIRRAIAAVSEWNFPCASSDIDRPLCFFLVWEESMGLLCVDLFSSEWKD